MEELIYYIPYFSSDSVWFWVFESILMLVTITAIVKSIFPEGSPVTGLSRGNKSRKFLLKTATAVMTFVVTFVFNITTSPKDGLVILYLINLIWIWPGVNLLCFFNDDNTMIHVIDYFKVLGCL